MAVSTEEFNLGMFISVRRFVLYFCTKYYS